MKKFLSLIRACVTILVDSLAPSQRDEQREKEVLQIKSRKNPYSSMIRSSIIDE